MPSPVLPFSCKRPLIAGISRVRPCSGILSRGFAGAVSTHARLFVALSGLIARAKQRTPRMRWRVWKRFANGFETPTLSHSPQHRGRIVLVQPAYAPGEHPGGLS